MKTEASMKIEQLGTLFEAACVCTLCGAPARLEQDDLPGYRAGTRFAIYCCTGCGSSFAQPMTVDEKLYEDIYRNAAHILAYSRYVELSERIMGAPDPLHYLGEQEDDYWGVAQILRAHPNWKRVLEIGSGFGYLTYALSRAGYEARGIDLSEQAVASARSRFGDLYEVGDFGSYRGRSNFEGWDALVCTQLLEHIADVHAFVSSALQLLRPGGGLIISTPNKSFYPSTLVWGTDLPPVHLWWFSERSIVEIATRHGCEVSAADFTQFNRRHQRFVPIKSTGVSAGSRIDAAGNSLIPPHERSMLWGALRLGLRIPGVWQVACWATGRRKVIGPGGPTICVAMIPPDRDLEEDGR
jgi:SAM-dependent methyltransferase